MFLLLLFQNKYFLVKSGTEFVTPNFLEANQSVDVSCTRLDVGAKPCRIKATLRCLEVFKGPKKITAYRARRNTKHKLRGSRCILNRMVVSLDDDTMSD